MKVLHQFIRHVSDARKGEHNDSISEEGTIVSQARLNEFVVTLLYCVGGDIRDTVGDQRKKMTHDVTLDALSKARRADHWQIMPVRLEGGARRFGC